MARTQSNMLPLGTQAPAFSLPDTVSGETLSLDQIHGKEGTVVMFICNHCPFVKHLFTGIVDLANDYICKGVSFLAISSNDVKNYPDDSPDLMTKVAAEQKFPFPYFYDETQEVARAYDAACTPDFYIFNKKKSLVYRGQFDDSRPENGIPVTGNDMRFVKCVMEGNFSDPKPISVVMSSGRAINTLTPHQKSVASGGTTSHSSRSIAKSEGITKLLSPTSKRHLHHLGSLTTNTKSMGCWRLYEESNTVPSSSCPL